MAELLLMTFGSKKKVSHPYKQSECMLPLPTFHTSDGRTVADDVRQPITNNCVASLEAVPLQAAIAHPSHKR